MHKLLNYHVIMRELRQSICVRYFDPIFIVNRKFEPSRHSIVILPVYLIIYTS